MGRINRHGKLSKKITTAPKPRFEPEVFVDHHSDFASIKLAKGIEAKSYLKDGFVFCEDKAGRIIEIQVLNLSPLGKKNSETAA
jgi:hypothetical protein